VDCARTTVVNEKKKTSTETRRTVQTPRGGRDDPASGLAVLSRSATVSEHAILIIIQSEDSLKNSSPCSYAPTVALLDRVRMR
jgi:hypothetical protein